MKEKTECSTLSIFTPGQFIPGNILNPGTRGQFHKSCVHSRNHRDSSIECYNNADAYMNFCTLQTCCFQTGKSGFKCISLSICTLRLRPTLEKLFTGVNVWRWARKIGAGCKRVREIKPRLTGIRI